MFTFVIIIGLIMVGVFTGLLRLIIARDVRSWVKGAVAGFVLWLHDWDFFLNATGAHPHISGRINNVVQSVMPLDEIPFLGEILGLLIIPVITLVVGGALAGCLIGFLFNRAHAYLFPRHFKRYRKPLRRSAGTLFTPAQLGFRWNWWAFLFPEFWLMWHQLFRPGTLAVCLNMVYLWALFGGLLNKYTLPLAVLVTHAVFGIKADRLFYRKHGLWPGEPSKARRATTSANVVPPVHRQK